MPSYHVEMRSYRLVGWVCLVFFTFCTVAAFLSGHYWPALGLAVFAVLGLYIVLGAGSFDIDGDRITHRSWFGTWQILWDEINHAEVGETDGTLVLTGIDKRFVLSPPGWWSGPAKEEALRFVVKQLEARRLSPQPSRSAAYKIMKNTRIR